MSSSSIKFPRNEKNDFFAELRSRVNLYFKENNVSKYGDWRMKLKTIVLISSYFLWFSLIIFLAGCIGLFMSYRKEKA